MLKDKWLNRSSDHFNHSNQRGTNEEFVPERKNITSNRVFPPMVNMVKTPKTPLPMPEHLADALLSCGYHAPEWTPAGCRRFLADLMREWPGFEVVGWYGCRFLECWPAHLMDAVTSIYVQSLQDQGETPEEQAI